MSCEAFGLLISKWVDGEAKPDEARRVEAHVAACASCRRLADEFRRNEALVEAAFGPESFGQRVAGGVLSKIARRESVVRWGARLAVAAGVLAAILWMRADRRADERERTALIQAYMQRLAALEAAIAQAPEPRTVVVEKYIPVPVDRRLPGGEGEAVVKRDPEPVPPEEPPHPYKGTVAMDRVDGLSDANTGAVNLSWTMLRSQGATFFVYRRSGQDDWGLPLNPEPLLMARFVDTTARGLTTYEYRVIAMTGGIPQVSDRTVVVTTPPDLIIKFHGAGGEKDGRKFGLFSVRVRSNGAWHEEAFSAFPGSLIGQKVKDVDFSTGFVVESLDEAEQLMVLTGVPRDQWPSTKRPRARLTTPAGTVHLWSQELGIGTRERIEPAQVEDSR